ncbi:MAG: methionine--tRNA ligase, partial [Chloroflexota bacterium]|nr:methionine--tRNA ligase [Chloroflexota bacterium]
ANVPADVFARYQRLAGRDVLMVSGSDMHGTPITFVADQRGTTPRAVAEENHAVIADAFARLGCSFDLYTSTLTDNHYRVTQDMFLRLLENGYLFEQTTVAAFDAELGRFLPDRYIEGICPHCGFRGARGDQCDNCGRTLDPFDLIEPRSRLSGSTPVPQETTHFFLDLPKFTEPLITWIEEKRSIWRPNVGAFVLNWLKEGLRPRAITRDLDWGVPVPVAGFEDKRIYVWFDAVIGYLSASIEWAERRGEPDAWHRWWDIEPDDDELRSYYFVGKDNIPFHALVWPAMLLGYGGLELPYDVPANEFLTVGGQKISSSRAATTDRLPWLHEALDLFDADALRYFLTINAPENRDTDFSWAEFQRRNNDELVATYGNAVHRVLRFIGTRLDGKVPEAGHLRDEDRAILLRVEQTFHEAGERLDRVRLRDGLASVMALAHDLNRYLDAAAPWKQLREDPARAQTSLWVSVQVIAGLRTLTAPFLPFSAEKVHEYLGEPSPFDALTWEQVEVPSGRVLGESTPLFRKLDDEELSALLDRLRPEPVATGEPT